MNEKLFIEHYKRFNEEDEAIQLSIHTIIAFEEYIKKDIEDSIVEDISLYMKHLIDTKSNKYNNVIHIARYYYYADMKAHYIHMTKYFNSLGVLEHIIDRISIFDSTETLNKVLTEVELPPFGTDSTELPHYTKKFLDALQNNLPRSTCNKVLAGNNHQISASSFNKEKEYYEQAESFAEYLEDRHERKVAELEDHFNNNKIWFEQIITNDVIEFVRNNPEVLSGVIKDDKLYITKIPYDINNYLQAEDDKMKRYYTCHCSFVRENILTDEEDIPTDWCYCSGGFAKYPFETILGQDLDVKLLTTPLNGKHLCRFEIDLKGIEYKK